MEDKLPMVDNTRPDLLCSGMPHSELNNDMAGFFTFKSAVFHPQNVQLKPTASQNETRPSHPNKIKPTSLSTSNWLQPTASQNKTKVFEGPGLGPIPVFSILASSQATPASQGLSWPLGIIGFQEFRYKM